MWIDQAGIDVSTKSIQEIERARKAEPETGTQTGQVRAMPGGGLFGRRSAWSKQLMFKQLELPPVGST